MNKKNISFVIFTFNEEKRIENVVKDLITYGNVLVFDDGSSDRTKEITESLGAKFILRPKTEKYSVVENPDMYAFVKSKVETDWIYWGFADHLLPKQLLEKMTELSQQNAFKYVYLPIYTYLWGDTSYPAVKGNYPIFYMKDCVDFSVNRIHGMGKFTGKQNEILKLPNRPELTVRHYSLYNQNKFINTHLRYAEIEAQQKFNDGKRFSTMRMIAAMLRYFFLFYKFGFKKHTPNLITSLTYSFFRLMAYARLYEIENNITLEGMESKYNEDREKILNELK